MHYLKSAENDRFVKFPLNALQFRGIPLLQKAKSIPSIRYSRWVVIRNTYPELKTTTVQTWDSCINGIVLAHKK